MAPSMADGNNNDFFRAVQEDHKIRKPLEHTAANFEWPSVAFQPAQAIRRVVNAVERSLQFAKKFTA